jgi:GntR family transcriptional regulator/MocR family aminotransferase
MRQSLIIEEMLDLELNVTLVAPLYLQLYQAIMNQIMAGKIPLGARLPASRKLAQQLTVSRNTVQKAYEQLIAEGYLNGKVGSGIYVTAEIPSNYYRKKKILPINKNEVASINEVGDFTPGIPDLQLFPHQLWARCCHKVLRHQYKQLLVTSSAYGNLILREAITDYLTQARGVRCTPEQIIITAGSQEAINLVIKTLLQPTQSIAIENPGYRGVYYAARANQANITPAPVLQDGIDLEYLRKQKKSPHLIYVTPSHQYPLGATLPVSKRLELIQLAKKNDSYIIEDDYDSEFHYQVKPLPSMQGLDQDDRVIYLGTFSKMLFPALRLGFLVVPPTLAAQFAQMKLHAFGHTSLFNQAVVAEFIASGQFTRHLKRMRLIYAEKYKAIVAACEQHLPKSVQLHAQNVGLHVTLIFRNSINDQAFVKKINKIGLYPSALSSYYQTPQKQSGLVLGFGNMKLTDIEPGIMKIAQALKR